MGDTGKTSIGTTLSGATAGAIASIKTLRAFGGAVDIGDISTLADTWKNKISGQKDAGTASVTCEWDSDDYDVCIDNVGVKQVYTITDPDSNTWACSGIISTTPEVNYDGSPITFNFNIEFSEQPTYTEGT
jgi:hypothetical protein